MSQLITAEMKNQQPGVIMNIIIDESGSMMRREEEVINGFNEYIQNQRKTAEAQRFGNVYVSLTKFSNTAKVIFAAKEISQVAEMTKDDYKPDGITALNDAYGKTIAEVSEAVKDWTAKPSVLTVLITDGGENASTDYTSERVSQLIDEKEKEGWTFVFLGSDRKSFQTAQKLGIRAGNFMQYDNENYKGTMEKLSYCSARYTTNRIADSFKEVEACDRSVANFFVEDDQA